MKYHIAKGVFDILPDDPDPKGTWRNVHLWHHIESLIRETCSAYGFREIRTPLFETTDLFQRSIGKTTDIVVKEMYTFHDKANRMLTLRPEGTAPVMRSFIEKGLFQRQKVHKFYYLMPMFRYERQQQGRYRQHNQFGVEAIGALSPYQDVEVIALFYRLLERLGLKGLTLQINSIGTNEEREAYKKALKEALHPHFDELSLDSQNRYHTNVLRILDSKAPQDRALLKKIPLLSDYLGEESRTHIETVLRLLDQQKIPYNRNPFLVRGLDYYNHTVFEVTSEELGAQNSLGGGGRYDGLIAQLGGPDLPAVGFGAGLERIIQTLLAQKAPLPKAPHAKVLLIPLGEEAKEQAFALLCALRNEGVAAEMDFSGKKLKQVMNYANSSSAAYVALLGEDELASQSVTVKEMESGKEERVPFTEVVSRLQNG